MADEIGAFIKENEPRLKAKRARIACDERQ